jgi:hypothetical protein
MRKRVDKMAFDNSLHNGVDEVLSLILVNS